jgi:hypothetical protein
MARYGFGFKTFPTNRLHPDDLVVDDARSLSTALYAFCTSAAEAL